MVLRTQAAARPLEASPQLTDRFLPFVVIGDGCWEWAGTFDQRGYGRLSVKHQPLLAHRVSWVVFNGPLPARTHVLHRCDNPPCIRPDHLFLGSHRDNMEDAARKGRLQRDGRPGTSNPMAKLTEELVRQARRRHAAGEPIRKLAAEHGVSAGTMGKAIRGSKWGHVR